MADTKGYRHAGTEMTARPEIGAAPRFRGKKEPRTYRYDSSLSPALDWDTNPARETAAFLIRCIEEAVRLPPPHEFPERRRLQGADGASLLEVAGLQDALERLKRLQRPFLDWAGKAERSNLDVPTLPLFVHERLSTEAIVKTLEGHRHRADQADMFSLFADPHRPMAEQVRAFEHKDRWVNRMILGDSLVVMNSLLGYEGLGGQVQMIYMDPPYGVKFGSNFQPFIRKTGVGSDDADMTREPEMVQAYRDTWELGLHSYLTYLRDRLIVARDLLTPSGSIFVQISDENLHHVREVMDDVFGPDEFCAVIKFSKTSGRTPTLLSQVSDYILWYAKDKQRTKFRNLFEERPPIENPYERFICVETPEGKIIDLSVAQKKGLAPIPEGRLLRLQQATSQGETPADREQPVTFEGKPFFPPRGRHWSVTRAGMQKVADQGRAFAVGKTLTWKSYRDEFPFRKITDNWSEGVGASGFGAEYLYVVQTNPEIVKRCVLMTTDPGDLILDPTCGSGTTAYVSEQWGRRWITIDTSRVPLALARQRLLTATFPWYRLKDEKTGPATGFIYSRRKNRRGEEVGGIVSHITLKAIANSEPSGEEVLVDRPDTDDAITRITGPFVVEGTLPTPLDLNAPEPEASSVEDRPDQVTRMIEVLRRSPVLNLPGNRKVTLKNVRRPARSLSLSAEATVQGDASGRTVTLGEAIQAADEENLITLPFSSAPVALLFGPQNGPVSAKAVLDAAKEANVKGYQHLFVIGFAITPEARREIEGGEEVLGLPATWVTATMDLQMGDLLKNQRSSQIFAVCGLPEIDVTRLSPEKGSDAPRWQVRLLGLDVFDPSTMTTDHRDGDDVPAWMLDTNWSGMVFHADQVFFPRTSAWDSLRKALKATHDDSVWAHLAGDTSAPFEAEPGTEIAVKVIDDRGNELLVTKKLGD